MHVRIKPMVLLLGLLASSNVSAIETRGQAEMEKPTSCVKTGPGIRVQAGDTLSEIARNVVSPDFQSRKELERHLYNCNPDAFGDSRNDLIPGETLYIPISETPKLFSKSSATIPPPTLPALSASPTFTLPATILIVVCFLTLFILVALSMSLYRWRKTFRVPLAEFPLTAPVSFETIQQNVLTQTLAKLRTVITDSMNKFVAATRKNPENPGELGNIYVTLHGTLDKIDAEIRRLKKGYDAEVFRKFLIRFVRTDLAVNDFMQDIETKPKSLNVIKRLLEDALDECGVETFSPSIGEDYRRAEGVEDNPKKTLSDNATDHYKIAEVIQQGYRMKMHDAYETVCRAKVRIFVTQ